MGVTRHENVDFLLGSIHHDGDEILEVLLDGGSFLELVERRERGREGQREKGKGISRRARTEREISAQTHQPKPQVSSDLIVPGSSSVKLSSDILSDDL